MARFALTLSVALCALLAFAHASAQVPEVRFIVEAFEVDGENPLTQQETRALLDPYLGEHRGVAGLDAATEALEAGLRARGFLAHRATLPAQTLEAGVVRLHVVAFRVSRIEVTGNTHFSERNVLASVPALKAGATPDTRKLSTELLVANGHPARHIELRLVESEAQAAIDVRLEVQDRRPYGVFASFDNTGSDETGDTRLTVGAQHSNLFDRDHAVTLTYTTSPEATSRVKQYGLSYRVPVYPVGGVLSAFYIQSDVDSGTIAEVFEVSGRGEFLGAQYRHQLASLGRYTHAAAVGVDDKLFEDNSRFGRQPIGNDVRSRPLTLRYDATYQYPEGEMSGHVSYVRNLPGGAKNDDASYTLARFRAQQAWDAVRFGGNFEYALPARWRLQGRLDGQVSNEPLISGEQFGIGGAHSVHGYREREVSGDSGLTASLELWSRPLVGGLSAIGFADVGYRKVRVALPGENRTEALAGAGGGVHWRWRRNLSLRVDVARVLRDAVVSQAGDTKLHFSLFVRY